MRSKMAIFLGVVGIVVEFSCVQAHAQSAKCATVVECANKMVDLANNLKAQNTALITQNQELSGRIQKLESIVNNHSNRLDDTNKTDTALRNDLNRVSSRSLPQERNKCTKIDGGHPGDDFWCPAGMYLAGAENTSNSNSTVDMMWCCPSN